jgi:predicted ATPase/DNA-binding SARP family transcriptional activator
MSPGAGRTRFAVLGPLEAEVDGRPVDVTSPHQRTLVTVLLTDPGRPVATERLVDALWGQRPPPTAVNSLQSHIARLRRVLGAPHLLVRRQGGYLLAVSRDQVDATAFEDLVARADRTAEAAARVQLLDQALDLWRGEPPLPDGPWPGDAERLRLLRLQALETHAATLLQMGQADRAVTDLHAVLASDPLREAAVRLLVRSLAWSGRAAEADRVVQDYRRRLADEHGLDPSPALDELHLSLLRGELGSGLPDVVARRPGDRPGFVRPAPPRVRSRFVGRKQELEELRRLLAARSVVTVTGPGGVGKTRLVVELVASLGGPHRVVWVELADAFSVSDVLGRLALATGSATPADPASLEPVVEALGGGARLVVLDDCDQAAELVAEVCDRLVDAVPDLRVLATSRAPLHVESERVVRLHPLTVDDEGAEVSPALELFVDRAGDAVSRDDEEQLAVAREVVTRLDGLPLAIELAARQAGNLGLAVLRDRLHQPLDLLTARGRPAHPGHRGLRELVRWSTQLLTEVERTALRRLGVVVGRVPLDLLEDVLDDDLLRRSQVAGLVGSLVESSLVVREDPDRFGLLETIRAVVVEELEERGERLVLEARHCAAVTRAARERARALSGFDEARAVAALHQLVPDLQAAVSRAEERRDVVALCGLAAAVHRYAYHSQRYELLAAGERAAELLDAGARVATPAPPGQVAVALAGAAALALARGDLAGASYRAGQAVVAADGAALGLAAAWEVRGDVALVVGRTTEAGAAYDRAIAAAREAGLPAEEVDAWTGLALVHAYAGDYAAGTAAAREAERIAGPLGNPSASAWARYASGELEADRDPVTALSSFDAAAELGAAVDNHLVTGMAATAAAAVRARHGDPQPALDHFRRVLEHWRQNGGTTSQLTTVRNLAVLLARIGRDEAAATLLGAAHDSRLHEPERRRVALARATLAERLGAEAFEDRCRRGAGLGFDELVEVALAAVTES